MNQANVQLKKVVVCIFHEDMKDETFNKQKDDAYTYLQYASNKIFF